MVRETLIFICCCLFVVQRDFGGRAAAAAAGGVGSRWQLTAAERREKELRIHRENRCLPCPFMIEAGVCTEGRECGYCHEKDHLKQRSKREDRSSSCCSNSSSSSSSRGHYSDQSAPSCSSHFSSAASPRETSRARHRQRYSSQSIH